MSRQQDPTESDESDLGQFEKNRFFQGKLMTARDMETEQEYHAGRLHTLAQFVAGRGVLEGLEIRDVEDDGSELEVTLEPGVALDGKGRPIVVEHTTTKTLPAPTGDEIYLFLRYTEAALESVPVPEVKGARNEEYTSNRTVEVFELTYQETPPEDYHAIPEVDDPVRAGEDDDVDRESAGRELANAYHDRHRTPHEAVDDPTIFVGSFERGRDGAWTPGDETVRREVVYDNDMLYAALVDHVTDTDNPHGVPTQTEPTDLSVDLDEVEEFSHQLRILQAELEELKADHETMNRYVMRKSLKDKIRFFREVADRFEDHSAQGSKIAQEIVETSKEGMKEAVYDDVDGYRDHVGRMLELDITLGEALEESATEDSLERYVKAVTELQAALEDEASVLQVAETQDQVCEAADSLEVLYDIVPDE